MARLVLIVLIIAIAGCKSSRETQPAAHPTEVESKSEVAGEDGARPAESAVPIVVTDTDAVVRTAPSGKAKILKFATGQNAFLGKLEMEPGGQVPAHRDATEEYIYILEGSGVMTIDGKAYDVGPNTAIYMPANAEVSFEGGPEKLVALQVFAGPEPAAKYDAWSE